MTNVKVSSKYQVVIPRKIRNMMDIKPGQRVQVIAYQGRIVNHGDGLNHGDGSSNSVALAED